MKATLLKKKTLSPIIIFMALMMSHPLFLYAQPGDIKKEIKILEKTPGFYFKAKGASKEQALDMARQNIEKQIVNRYSLVKPVSSEKNPGAVPINIRLNRLPLTAKELSWGSGNREVFLFVSEDNAKAYAGQYATILYRDAEEYQSGEAFAASQDEAIALARGNLITQISANISTESNITSSERSTTVKQNNMEISTTENVRDEEFVAKNKVFSRMTLQGLKTISLKFGNEWFAFVYISLEDKEKSFESVKSKIITSADEAERAFSERNYTSAIKGYYKTYILSDTYYTNVPYTFSDGTKTENLQESMRSRLDVILKDQARVLARPAYQIDEKDIVAPFQVLFDDKPMDGLLFQFKFRTYNFTDVIRRGNGKLSLPGYLPEYPTEAFTVHLYIDISDDLKADPEIRELEAVKRLSISKTIQVDFRNIFKYSIEGKFIGKRVDLSLVNINPKLIREVHWILGDGEERYTSEPKLSYTYESLKQYEIRVEINSDPSLGLTRYLDLPEKRIRAQAGKPDPVAVIHQPTQIEKATSALVQQPNLVNNGDLKSLEINPEYKELAEVRTTSGLLTLLKVKKERNLLNFGKQADLLDSEGALILVADSENVYDRLVFTQNRFFKINDGKEVDSLTEMYRGKYLIWVKLN